MPGSKLLQEAGRGEPQDLSGDCRKIIVVLFIIFSGSYRINPFGVKHLSLSSCEKGYPPISSSSPLGERTCPSAALAEEG